MKAASLKYGTLLAGGFLLAVGTAHADNHPIVIGVPTGLSGANSTVAPAVVQSSELAVEQINANGGVLGRDLVIEVADDQSGAQGAQRAFDDLIRNRGADVIISMETSAAREAGVPIAEETGTPYIYTSLYEGRSCNNYLYANGSVPEQMVSPIVDYFMDTEGAETFFLVGSDYNFGRGMLGFSRDYIESSGGEVVSEEYQPMDAQDWSSIITRMRRTNPDAVIMSTAGGAPNVTLQRQFKAAGIDALVGNLSVDELTAQSMGADAEDVYISASYLTSLEGEHNEAFLDAMTAKFGSDLETPNDLSVPQYDAINLYAKAVEAAGTTEAGPVLEALEQVSFNGPRGEIQMDEQRHAALTMNLGRVQADGSVEVVERFAGVSPGTQCPEL